MHMENILSNNFRIKVLALAQETFLKIDHMLGHKATLSKNKRQWIIPCILLSRKVMKLETIIKKKH